MNDIYYLKCVYRCKHRNSFSNVDGWAIANGTTPEDVNSHPINNKSAQRRMKLTTEPVVVQVKSFLYLGKKIQ